MGPWASLGPSLLPSLRAAVLLGALGYAWPGAGVRKQPGLCLVLKPCPWRLPHSSDAEQESWKDLERAFTEADGGGMGENKQG